MSSILRGWVLLPILLGLAAVSSALEARAVYPHEAWNLPRSHALILEGSADAGESHTLLVDVIAAIEAVTDELTSDRSRVDRLESVSHQVEDMEERLWLLVDSILPAEVREQVVSSLPAAQRSVVTPLEHALYLPGITAVQAAELLALEAPESADPQPAAWPELIAILTDEQQQHLAATPPRITPTRRLQSPTALLHDLVLETDARNQLDRLSRRARRRARRVTEHVAQLRKPGRSRLAQARAADPAAITAALNDIRGYRAKAFCEILSPAQVIEWVRGTAGQIKADRTRPKEAAKPLPYDGAAPTFVAGTNRIEVAGLQRLVEISLPEEPTGAPVVFLWHGLGDSARSFSRNFDTDAIVNRHGAIVVTPHSSGLHLATEWAYLSSNANRDLAVFDNVLTCLDRQFDIDNERVYTTGFSAGALWSTYLLLHRSEYLAAVVLFSGGVDDVLMRYETPTALTPVLVIQGGPNDTVGVVDFHTMSNALVKALRRDGHFVVSYDHGKAHSIPFDPDRFALPFLFADSKTAEQLPYADGLGDLWPEDAKIE